MSLWRLILPIPLATTLAVLDTIAVFVVHYSIDGGGSPLGGCSLARPLVRGYLTPGWPAISLKNVRKALTVEAHDLIRAFTCRLSSVQPCQPEGMTGWNQWCSDTNRRVCPLGDRAPTGLSMCGGYRRCRYLRQTWSSPR